MFTVLKIKEVAARHNIEVEFEALSDGRIGIFPSATVGAAVRQCIAVEGGWREITSFAYAVVEYDIGSTPSHADDDKFTDMVMCAVICAKEEKRGDLIADFSSLCLNIPAWHTRRATGNFLGAC